MWPSYFIPGHVPREVHTTAEISAPWFFLLLPYSLYQGNGTTQLSCQQVSE